MLHGRGVLQGTPVKLIDILRRGVLRRLHELIRRTRELTPHNEAKRPAGAVGRTANQRAKRSQVRQSALMAS
jgi:hypothetical protein